jgi:hypothetical protein
MFQFVMQGQEVFTRSVDDGGGQSHGVGDVLDALLGDDVRVGRHAVKNKK